MNLQERDLQRYLINKERIRNYLDDKDGETFVLRSPYQFEGTIDSITVREIKPLDLPLDARLQYQIYFWSSPIRWFCRWMMKHEVMQHIIRNKKNEKQTTPLR